MFVRLGRLKWASQKDFSKDSSRTDLVDPRHRQLPLDIEHEVNIKLKGVWDIGEQDLIEAMVGSPSLKIFDIFRDSRAQHELASQHDADREMTYSHADIDLAGPAFMFWCYG